MNFKVLQCRYRFRAANSIRFAPGSAANLFRGALGILLRQMACDAACPGARTCPDVSRCGYARCFEPRQSGQGPSGFEDLPRPFVLRASGLDGLRVDPGGEFMLDLNLFDLTPGIPELFAAAFTQLEWTGLGPGRPRIVLRDLARETVEIPLQTEAASAVRIVFRSPTELKSQGRVIAEPAFDVLFARARDRVSQLRELYQEGALDLDFRGLGERSRAVRMVANEIRQEGSARTSARTGQRHALAGFTGEARYEGDLGEFLPVLRAAAFTGVGRHTVWGLGALEIADIENKGETSSDFDKGTAVSGLA